MRCAMLLNIENLNKSWNQKEVIKDISFSVMKGQISCLLGPSGCGKSTLLRLLAGLDEINQGKISNNAKETSLIFQEPRLFPWLDVYENIELVLKDRIQNSAEKKEIIDDVLHVVNLDNYKKYYPKELSGGMKQRVSITRALAVDPELLLMDEPFANLDFPLRLDLIHILQKIFAPNDKGGIFVTHDNREALLLCDHLMIMGADPGQIKFELDIDIPRESRALNSPKLRSLNNQINDYTFQDQKECCNRQMSYKSKRRYRMAFQNPKL